MGTPTPPVLWPDYVLGLREHLGETQVAFAERLGCRQATVSNWERGRKSPTGLYAQTLLTTGQDAGYTPAE